MLAAEYVVGVLDAEERLKAAARIDRDSRFARLIEAWEARLSPLSGTYPEIKPPSRVKQAVDRVLFTGSTISSPSIAAARGSWWQSLVFWRSLAAAALVLLIFAVAVAVPVLAPRVGSPTTAAQYVASIAPKDSDVSYLAYYDPSKRTLSLSHVSGDRGSGHDFELWAIERQAKPVSLGVIPAGKTVHMTVSAGIAKELANGGVLAISIEPFGGSPTGQATGPVVAAGDLNRI